MSASNASAPGPSAPTINPSLGGKPADAFERELITPEGVDLRIVLATASERAGAFLVDAAIIVAIIVAASILCALAAWATNGTTRSLIGVLWLLGFFLLRNAWFLIFELGPRAATPGKRVFGLRVASRQGGRLTADAIFARNAMREIELFLPLTFLLTSAGGVDAMIVAAGLLWTGVLVLFPLFNRDRLRAGDLVAGTWVVREPRRTLTFELAGPEIQRAGRFIFEPAQLKAYGIAELHVLEDVLREADRDALGVVAERIRAKIGWAEGPDESDRAFLRAYYAGLRSELEGELLRGRRRRDKHHSL